MHIINLTPLEVGVYNDHKSDHITAPPEGWAMIPDDMALPSTFPRLGSIEAEEITYTYEVEVEKDVVKTRDVEVIGEDGEPVIVQEEYTEKVMVTEQRERVIMTVVEMTEGTLPEPVEQEPTNDELVWQAITDLEIAQMEYEQALTDLEIAQLEG
jgi:hypothetical protein